MKALCILVADDHEVVRNGLRLVLERAPGWTVCGETATGRETVRLAEELEPDIVVVDFNMPELNGLNAVFAALIITGLGAGAAFAGNTAQQLVTYEAQTINELLSVSLGTVWLMVNSATACQAPNVATDTPTIYAITTNKTGRKITGALNSDMPAGATLSVTLAPPTGTTGTGRRGWRLT